MKNILNIVNSNQKIIIFTHGGGRFGNQMFSYAQLLAFALEHGNVDFINMACWEYADLLETGQNDRICVKSSNSSNHIFHRLLCFLCANLYIKNDSIAKNIIIYLLYFFAGNPLAKYYGIQSVCKKKIRDDERFLVAQKIPNLDLADPAIFDLINKSNITFLSGWNICDWELVKKHQDEIRRSLQVSQKYLSASKSFVNEQRQKYDFMVGVLIRQGDYELWENGKYYFSTEQYSIWMSQLNEVLQYRGRVGFIIASNTAQNPDDFPNINVHFTTGIAGSSGHYIESLSQISLCDVLMSPPSSFSLWAAFLGDIPFIPLLNLRQSMKQDNLLDQGFFDCVGIAY